MVRKTTLVVGTLGGLVATVGAWNLYQRYSTPEVPYTTVARIGDVELRRYPAVVLAETVAPTQNEAFGRLFRYIAGENEASNEISMTAPVEVDSTSASIPMTSPVEVGTPDGETISITSGGERGSRKGAGDDGVRMAFYLPEEYDLSSAPKPTNDDVELVVVPERTLAVRRFSWRATDERIERERESLRTTLENADIATEGEPFFMGYDAPWTLPFLRRNEIAIEVR